MKYSIGLDIGVSSVGWACMTKDYSIPKFNGRYAMGVREFESAKTAEERRIQRGTRRRYNRRIKRIQLLQKTLSPLLVSDKDFFYTNNEKEIHFWNNSNDFENNSLSEILTSLGENKRKYPTIYHLREALMTENREFHPKLIYLGLHHLTKFRGHFLNENMNWNSKDSENDLSSNIKHFFDLLIEKMEYPQIDMSDDIINKIINILNDNEMTGTDKRKGILISLPKDYQPAISLLVGLSTDAHKLFEHSSQAKNYKEEKVKLDLTKDDLVESYEKLSDEEQIIIDQAHLVYQEIILKDLLGDASFVSEAKVNAYNQFRKDLTELQGVYNKYYDENIYRAMFITSSKNMTIFKNKRDPNALCEFDKFLKLKSKYEESFYTKLLKDLKVLYKQESDSNELKSLIDSLENNKFLQKQKGQMNAAIPHQNNVYEAVTILKQQKVFHTEITNEMIERVEQIISFRIPYYVGPLVKKENQGNFGWVKRKGDSSILPWNFDETVNRSESAEAFITRMTSMCTYLLDEKVLPKHSLAYQKFELLNELNGIQLRSESEKRSNKYRLDREVKEWLIENIFTKYKTVTHKRVIDALVQKYPELMVDINTGEIKQIYGTQQENRFNTSLSSYIDMTHMFEDIDKVDKNMLEELIYWISVFEDKEIIELKIKEKYPEITIKQMKTLVSKNYVGWGNLSSKLLTEMPINEVTGASYLEIMENESKVFMEILHEEKYDLEERISKINQVSSNSFEKIKYEDIVALHGSPAIKKGIWQAILVIEELVDIYGEPEHIMLEFAREDQLSQRTKSRKKQIDELQKSVSGTEKALKSFLKEQSRYEEYEYKNNRLYLYITQEGKCMYSGESLDVNQLHTYEVDHILPQSFVKDDSIDNIALVKTKMNAAKSGTKMPLEIMNTDQISKQKSQWQKLFKHNLISQKKYYRLLKESFSSQDKESFFARQLVETRQITKHVKDLLDERFEDTEVHTVNANIVTNLRKHSEAYKIRDLNNKHHAVDAALTNLVVQFIINTYGSNFLSFNFKYQEANKKWRDMMLKYKKNFFLFGAIDKSTDFKHYRTNESLSGREYLALINDEMPWQTTKKIGNNEAAFYKQTLFSPKVKDPKYTSPKTALGVYDEVKTDKSYLISFKERNSKNKMLVANATVDLNVIESYQIEKYDDKEKAIFLAKNIAKHDVLDAIIHTEILKFQTILVNNHKFNYVSSREMHNGKQLVLKKETLDKLYFLINEKNETESDKYSELFLEIVNHIVKDYQEIIPEKRVPKIFALAESINTKEEFLKILEEIFKMASAGATRSEIFGGRYVKKQNPLEMRFVYESITGLRYRKPKSFKNELWTK